MPAFQLPGINGLTLGIDSAIGTQSRRSQSAISDYLATLEARRAAIADNDNLEFRRNLAEQPAGTPVLNRLDNVVGQSANPNVLAQALIAQQSFAPALATRGLANPAFAQAQGIPGTFGAQTQAGLFGAQPLFDIQANQQRQALFNQASSLQNSGFQNTVGATAATQAGNTRAANDNNTLATIAEGLSRLEEENKALRQQISGLSSSGLPSAQSPLRSN